MLPYVCFSVPPGYVYPPYLTAAPGGIVPLPPAPVSHAAALAAAAAATTQFYEYQNAAAAAAVTYPGQYPNGFETYPYTGAAGGFTSCNISRSYDGSPCSVVEVYRRFRGTCCLHHHSDRTSTRLHGATIQKTTIFFLFCFDLLRFFPFPLPPFLTAVH
jgi:hypothetical protein